MSPTISTALNNDSRNELYEKESELGTINGTIGNAERTRTLFSYSPTHSKSAELHQQDISSFMREKHVAPTVTHFTADQKLTPKNEAGAILYQFISEDLPTVKKAVDSSSEQQFKILGDQTSAKWSRENYLCVPRFGYFCDIKVCESTCVAINVRLRGEQEYYSKRGLISANYVNFTKFESPAIASEYPRPEGRQFGFFFKMVIQTEIGLIVDLVGSSINGKVAYPTCENPVIEKDSIRVEFVQSEGCLDVYYVFDKKQEMSCTTFRLHCDDWKDRNDYDLNKFDALLDDILVHVQVKRLLVHCSAGIGRTSVVLVALSLIKYRHQLIPTGLTIEQLVDDEIFKLRLQRSPKCIQTAQQRDMLIRLLHKWQAKVGSMV
ncbi:MAG: protein-tyrosine phosphatase family protein [Parashewanella sp.]